MSEPLLDLSKLTNHAQMFSASAERCGFTSLGEINRFIFKSYGKAIRSISHASLPKGAIFILSPARGDELASNDSIRAAVAKIRSDHSKKFYRIRADLSSGLQLAHEIESEEKKQMAMGGWTPAFAMNVSRITGECVVWVNGVSACVYLDGLCYIESPDTVEEIAAGIPGNFQSLSWKDGELLYDFARSELTDTTATGVWHSPNGSLLRPKPEKLMSSALGNFLRFRMAGYKHHDEEAHVEHQGRADISLHSYNGCIYIVEVKWIGRSLKSTRLSEPSKSIEAELKKFTSSWITEFGDEAFESGAKQLAKYFGTGKYDRAYLAVFDCRPPVIKRKSESLPVDPRHVAPHSLDDFCIYRACADPRKASKASKAGD
ncbi:hypothetical protein [Luteolibacter luteus]|uniref:Uncharacterized protein n=1 Tax=Luteolibacter luteus TaxID=2728835 RepID=A0A858RCM3_9BACT|nr:hypothetical protein [Luteolibacter luteus]QJE94786.1 hypothetical protein HHL09_02990 [Luteolibacter luteus]